MGKKPPNLIYGVEERPPLGQTVLLALQHVSVCFSLSNVFPVIVGRAANASPETINTFVSMSMLACGIGTILQALRRFSIGCGYLCPQGVGPSYLASSIYSVQTAGFHVLFGMTLLAGIIESLFSRIVQRARVLFPTEVTGTLVTMVGVTIIPLAIRYSIGLDATHAQRNDINLLVAALTFAAIVSLNVFGKGKSRLFCVLIGGAFGYSISYYTGLLKSEDLKILLDAPWLAFPDWHYFGLGFKWTLFAPFAIAAAASTFKSIGDVVLCQKINDADWKRPDMKNVSDGINADGWASTVAGLLGGMGPSTYSSNIGLSMATGATSRIIAYVMGGILIVLSIVPKIGAVFVVMPKPVIGATILFAICFMMLTGIQIIQSRLLDARKIFVIGISLALGLSVDMVPEAYRNVPGWLEPFTSSSLSMSTITVIILNFILRIGIKKTASLDLFPGDDSSKISNFMEIQGGAWGARKDVVYRATGALKEFLGSSRELELYDEKISVKMSFDEFNLNMLISYSGQMMPFPEDRPTRAAFRTDEGAVLKLSGFLMRQYSDALKLTREGEKAVIFLHFDH